MIAFTHNLFATLPRSPFLMGTAPIALSGLAQRYGGTRESYREESPQHHLSLPSFALARVPVSNQLYSTYVKATGAQPPSHWRAAEPPEHLLDHPVVNISWHDAMAFCAWLANSAPHDPAAEPRRAWRLPTEAEWEYAARGVDGRSFPWGESFDTTLANTRESGLATTTEAGAYAAGASPCGALDMAGNVWEWTASLDRPYPYVADDGREDPAAQGRRILRGGCYANPHGFARCACRFRLLPGLRNEFIGFRLAVSIVSG